MEPTTATLLRLERYREELIRICETVAEELDTNRQARDAWQRASIDWRRAYVNSAESKHDGADPSH